MRILLAVQYRPHQSMQVPDSTSIAWHLLVYERRLKMASKSRLLVVDPSEETREVLRTALAGRGGEIFESACTDDGLRIAHISHPDVIVVDLECETARAAMVVEGFRESAGSEPPSILILGTARQAQQAEFEVATQSGQFVRKPYHYGLLIRRIEELLAIHEQPAERAA
jgi:CheY-like chemotaxis protein